MELSRCGIKCGECTYREQFNCSGCHAQEGKMFWGECNIAKCSIDKGIEDCGKCGTFPCNDLNGFAFDKEHGDNGERIENLKKKYNG